MPSDQPHSPAAKPLVVSTINNPTDLHSTSPAAVTEICDVLEFRLDGLQSEPATDLKVAIESYASVLPIILTARREDEGAFAPMNENDRIEQIKTHLHAGALVDIEFRTIHENPTNTELNSLLDAVARHRGTLVTSFHDFVGVPDQKMVEDHIACAEKHQAIAKIAATVNSIDDLGQWTDRLAQLQKSGTRFSFMGMGKFGMATRLTAASAGSELNYGFLKKASVPGQWPAVLLKQTIANLA